MDRWSGDAPPVNRLDRLRASPADGTAVVAIPLFTHPLTAAHAKTKAGSDAFGPKVRGLSSVMLVTAESAALSARRCDVGVRTNGRRDRDRLYT